MTKSTMERLQEPDKFSSRYLGKVLTKGKKEHVEIFEILDGEADDRKKVKLRTKLKMEDGVRAFHRSEYSLAMDEFNSILKIDPLDDAVRYYLKRSAASLDLLV